MQQYVDIYSLSRHSTCFGCHAPIIRSTKNCIKITVDIIIHTFLYIQNIAN